MADARERGLRAGHGDAAPLPLEAFLVEIFGPVELEFNWLDEDSGEEGSVDTDVEEAVEGPSAARKRAPEGSLAKDEALPRAERGGDAQVGNPRISCLRGERGTDSRTQPCA